LREGVRVGIRAALRGDNFENQVVYGKPRQLAALREVRHGLPGGQAVILLPIRGQDIRHHSVREVSLRAFAVAVLRRTSAHLRHDFALDSERLLVALFVSPFVAVIIVVVSCEAFRLVDIFRFSAFVDDEIEGHAVVLLEGIRVVLHLKGGYIRADPLIILELFPDLLLLRLAIDRFATLGSDPLNFNLNISVAQTDFPLDPGVKLHAEEVINGEAVRKLLDVWAQTYARREGVLLGTELVEILVA